MGRAEPSLPGVACFDGVRIIREQFVGFLPARVWHFFQSGGSRGADFAGAVLRVSAGAKKQSIGLGEEAEFSGSRLERRSRVSGEQS